MRRAKIRHMLTRWRVAICLLATATCLPALAVAQVYSPKVLKRGQPDTTDLQALANAIYAEAKATTPHKRAKAIWRYFLTDGRFVKPGFWYHIAGWAYEEPRGEVLDPIKLMNSYGFGLCYQIAPVLEAVWKAGGFEDARVWFLTGHTVAEVFYDGAYHYFDSDMMGYTTVGTEPRERSPVASVMQLEDDASIILSKMKGPRDVVNSLVEHPWYPADVRAAAMDGLAELFTTKSDNHLFPAERAPQGHRMDFVLRPGERLIRYFAPEEPGLFYLPYKWTGRAWEEFPHEIAQYNIRTEDGPRSQKDARLWGTGRFEYRPNVTGERRQVFQVASPYVVIDARFEFELSLKQGENAAVLISTDEGKTWQAAGSLSGPHQGKWTASPAVLTRSEHGTRTAVSGRYGYWCAIEVSSGARLSAALLTTRVQLNPRTLPPVTPGLNEMVFTASRHTRRELPIDAESVDRWAMKLEGARLVTDGSQGYWIPNSANAAEMVFRLANEDGEPMSRIAAGGRFLDLRRGVAPDKFTAEIRPAGDKPPSTSLEASIAWSASVKGPYATLWGLDPKPRWRDGKTVDRVLLWPEADGTAKVGNAKEIYVRYRFAGMAIDDFRLAVENDVSGGTCVVEVTHVWKEDGVEKRHSETIPAGVRERTYSVRTRGGAQIENVAHIMECRR